MRLVSEIAERLRALFRRSAEERELGDEIRFHVEMETERLIRERRLSPHDAHRRAMIAFGGVERIKEEVRDERGTRWFDETIQDIRYAIRTLRKSPVFSGVVVLTLALGIGGTTAVFSVVQTVLLAHLPYEQPGQLVRFYQLNPENPSGRKIYLAGPHFREVRDHAASFENVTAVDTYAENGLDLVKDGRAERLRILNVTSDYFRTLGATLQRGREFDREDEIGTSTETEIVTDFGTSRLVLSDDLWRTRFDGDPSIIGATIRLSDQPFEVVGIAPPGLLDPIVGMVDAWAPYNLAALTLDQSTAISAIGRMRTGITLEQARVELTAMSRSLDARWPDQGNNTIDAAPLKDDLVATSRAPLQLLLIAVALVLLLGCVNVANLVLIRATGRAQELAIRTALGAGGARIARQLLVESALLAVLGGSLGLVLAGVGIDVLQNLGRDAITRLDQVRFDPMVLGFGMLVTVTTAVASGITPAIRFARLDPNRALGQQSRSATDARGQGRTRGGLAAAQLALAVTLLAGAGVLLVSFYQLQHVDLGFRVDRVLTFDLNLPSARYDAERRAMVQEELARRIETIPGVTAAGGISFLPATGSYHPWSIRVASGPLAGTWVGGSPYRQQRFVSGSLFGALEIPVVAGRAFEAQDDTDAPWRAVVSASFAERAFPDMPLEEVVGQRLVLFGVERHIIGVVGDVTLGTDPSVPTLGLDGHATPALVVYHAHRQWADNRNWALKQVVATDLPPERILPAVRDRVATMDPELVVYNAAPLADVVGQGISRERFALVLMGTFAVLALGMAALGLYGVLAYTVRLRRQEIGIRIALGATAVRVRAMVLRQAAFVVGIGLVAGIAGALVLGRWLSSLVFEISPWDPRILVATTVLLTVIALLSASLPAWRASRVEPRIALQEE